MSRTIPGGTAKPGHHQGARHELSWSAPSAQAHHGVLQCPMILEVSAQVSIAPQPQDSLCTHARGSLPLWVNFRAVSSLWAGCVGSALVPPLPTAGEGWAPGFAAFPPLPSLASPVIDIAPPAPGGAGKLGSSQNETSFPLPSWVTISAPRELCGRQLPWPRPGAPAKVELLLPQARALTLLSLLHFSLFFSSLVLLVHRRCSRLSCFSRVVALLEQ